MIYYDDMAFFFSDTMIYTVDTDLEEEVVKWARLILDERDYCWVDVNSMPCDRYDPAMAAGIKFFKEDDLKAFRMRFGS